MSKVDIATHRNRYMAAAHAMQSGVAQQMTLDGQPENPAMKGKPHSPKHLRTGINSAMVEHSALAQLLLDKGIITELEYVKALADGMEAEVMRYEKLLSERIGTRIKLA